MKKLIFSLAAVSLLATQLSAQVVVVAPPAPPAAPHVSVNVESAASIGGNVAVGIGRNVTVAASSNVAAVNGVNVISYDSRIQENYDGPKRTKNFTKTFALDNSDKISLANQYGSITIKTWDKKEIRADIVMEAYSNDEKEVQKLINDVNIEASKSGDLVTFRTHLSKGNYGSSISNGKVRWRREVKVNYTIYMPASNALTANTQYGNINMDNFSAPTSLKVQYGNLTAGTLSSNNNYMNVQYGKVQVAGAGNLEMNVQYAGGSVNTIKGNANIKIQYGTGGFNIGSVDNLDLDAAYTDVKVTSVNGNATVDQQYNSISIGTVEKLAINAEYANVTVGTLKGDGNFRISYNRLNIGGITNACKQLTIKSEYAPVSLDFSAGYNASYEVQTEYGGFKSGIGTGRQVKVNDDDDTKKNYAGKIGNGSGGIIKITSEYGAVTFK